MFFICVYISIIHSVTVNSCFIGHFVVIDEQLNHKFKCHLGYISNTVTMVKSQQSMHICLNKMSLEKNIKCYAFESIYDFKAVENMKRFVEC